STYGTLSFGGASPFGIAFDYLGFIWTANYDDNSVTMIEFNTPAFNATSCPDGFQGTGQTVYRKYTASSGIGTGPHGIAIDASRNIWVTNYGTTTTAGTTVAKLVPSYGEFCFTTSPAVVTLTPAPFSPFTVGNNPYAIAIDASGNAWVANSGSDVAPGSTVTKINPVTGLASTYSGPTASPLYGPHGIAIDTLGNVWVTNFGTTTAPGNTITELNSSGTFLNSFTVGFNPEGIVIDPSGNVWVANYYANNTNHLLGTLTVLRDATPGTHFFPYAGPIWP